MASDSNFDKFSQAELLALRDELLQSSTDSWQAAEVIASFLSGRGYGVSSQAARRAAARIDYSGVDSLRSIHDALEKIAKVM